MADETRTDVHTQSEAAEAGFIGSGYTGGARDERPAQGLAGVVVNSDDAPEVPTGGKTGKGAGQPSKQDENKTGA